MKITREVEIVRVIETYSLDGAVYKSHKEIKVAQENKLGAIIDSFDVTLTTKQKVKIFDGIVANMDALEQVLGVGIEVEDGYEPSGTVIVNILNLPV